MKNILIVKLSAIGDVIHAMPTLSVLRHNYPDAKITWIVGEKSADLVKDHPYIDEIICIDLRKMKYSEIIALACQLKRNKYDLVLDLQGLLKSGMISWCTRAPIRLVYPIHREGSGLLATKSVKGRPESLHVIQKCLDTVRELGLTITEENMTDFNLAILPEHKEFASQFLKDNGLQENDLIIGLNPGAAWATKKWPTQLFAQLADLLIKNNNAKILLFGAPSDTPLIEEIREKMQDPQNAVSCAGKTTLRQLAALSMHCQAFVASDTGPMHIAAAVGTPIVALFGPTDPNYSGPINKDSTYVWSQFPCAPCFKVHECPKGTMLACMKAVTPKMVYEKILNILKKS